MVVDQNSLVDILEKLFKKLGVTDKSITCDELIKKVINKNLTYSVQPKGIDLLSPDLLSAFFIKNMKMIVDEEKIKELNYKFDPEMIVKAVRCNNDIYELTDINRQKVKLHKKFLKIDTRKPIDLDVFLKVM